MGDSQLDIVVIDREPRTARGVAGRFGFSVPWTAWSDAGAWQVEVPRGHSLGPDGKGAFELVTDDNWPAFTAAITRALQGET